MPALITHYLFGEEALPSLEGNAAWDEGRRRAFLLGCQGPDPFFFAVTSLRGNAQRSLASHMHRRSCPEAFEAIRDGLGLLAPDDRPIGTAFACGLLAHYALDVTAHPYVYAMEGGLCGASPDLADARGEVHAVIESDLDAGMLALLRGVTCGKWVPVSALEGDARAESAAGALMAHCAQAVFGLDVRPVDYAGALADMRLCYRAIEPAGSALSRGLGRLERLARKHSQLEALAHRDDLDETCASMNPGGRTWTDPFTGTVSDEGFAAVFARAQQRYERDVAAFLGGRPCAEITRGLDYAGRPVA